MKYALLLLLSIPAFAFEESGLKYSYLSADYTKTKGTAPASDATTTGASIQKRFTENFFAGIGFASTAQDLGPFDATVTEISGLIGARAPLNESIDAVLTAAYASAKVEAPSVSASGNGTFVSLGVRGVISPVFEGTIDYTSYNLKINGNSDSDSYASVLIGANVTPSLQITGGIKFKDNQSTSIGLRLFF
jgi:hypothetical protein